MSYHRCGEGEREREHPNMKGCDATWHDEEREQERTKNDMPHERKIGADATGYFVNGESVIRGGCLFPKKYPAISRIFHLSAKSRFFCHPAISRILNPAFSRKKDTTEEVRDYNSSFKGFSPHFCFMVQYQI